MTAPELKPCPFCGEEPNDHDFDTSWVRCLGCGAESGWGAPAEAIAAWNRRTASIPQLAPDVRVVMAAQLERWATEWADTCDAVEEDLGSVPFDRNYIAEIRAIIGENDND